MWGYTRLETKTRAVLDRLPSLKLTFSPLKMDGWNISFLLGWPIFRCDLLVFGSVIESPSSQLLAYLRLVKCYDSPEFTDWESTGYTNKQVSVFDLYKLLGFPHRTRAIPILTIFWPWPIVYISFINELHWCWISRRSIFFGSSTKHVIVRLMITIQMFWCDVDPSFTRKSWGHALHHRDGNPAI